MKNYLKYLVLFSFCLMLSVVMIGCENSTALRTASFSDISISGSDNYGVAVKFAEDKRLEDKYVDVQVKSNKAIGNIYIWEDNGEKYKFSFAEADSWNSITSIFVNGKGKPNTEKFVKYSNALSKRYLLSSGEEVDLVFRVVVGDVTKNAQETGEVLVGSEQISDEFTLKVEGKDNNNIED